MWKEYCGSVAVVYLYIVLKCEQKVLCYTAVRKKSERSSQAIREKNISRLTTLWFSARLR
jgi:hypothetical protein